MITRVLARGRQRGFHMERSGEGNVMMEAETGVVRPLAKDRQQLPDAGRGKEWILL